jgi:hypothetical protein
MRSNVPHRATLFRREWLEAVGRQDTLRQLSDIRDSLDIRDESVGLLSTGKNETPVPMIAFSPCRTLSLNPADACRQQDIREVSAGVVHQ